MAIYKGVGGRSISYEEGQKTGASKPVDGSSDGNQGLVSELGRKIREDRKIGYKFLYTNIRSVMGGNNREELIDMVEDQKPEVVVLTETWGRGDIGDAEVNLPGYKMIREDREPGKKLRGGGIMVFGRVDISIRRIKAKQNQGWETLWVEIATGKGLDIIIGVYYLLSEANKMEVRSLFKELNEFKEKSIFLLGDFNMPGIDWDLHAGKTQKEQIFIDCANKYFLKQ